MSERQIEYFAFRKVQREIRTKKMVYRWMAQTLDEWLREGLIEEADKKVDLDEVRRMIKMFRDMGRPVNKSDL